MKILLTILILFLSGFGSLKAQNEVIVDSSIVREVDIIPQFVGGAIGWQRFLENNLNLSSVFMAMDSTEYVQYGLRQTAILEFTVCEDGEICDIDIINKSKISPAFARETMRIIKKSPKWKAAIKDDKPVRTRIRQPIVAILDDYLP
ncbi:energy transducer TonB [Sphingobacterium mizutaii]|uniref:energy transducer TonB n=1 Tax=Sphingobacterium mizutaii TaxID=1010 RepID=UPI0028A17F43|nr:energy transducer TonB [Sphingobacterium mizutaii]